MLMSRQVTVPGMGGLAAAAQLRDDRLARRRRSGDADDIERDIVEQAEIRAALPDRQMLGQVPVRAQRPHAQLGNRRLVVIAAELDERDEHVGAGIVRRTCRTRFSSTVRRRGRRRIV